MKDDLLSLTCRRLGVALSAVAASGVVGLPRRSAADNAPALPSWNDGPAKQAILDLVRATTEPAAPTSCPPPTGSRLRPGRHALGRASDIRARPMFALDRVRALSPEHPEWKSRSRSRRCSRATARRWRKVQRGRTDRDRRRHPCRDEHRSIREIVQSGWQRRRIRASSGRTRSSSTSRCWRSWTICAPTDSAPTSSPAAARSSCVSTPDASTASRRSRSSARAS